MIVVDVETSGLDDQKNSLLSIGAVDFYNPENQFYGECRIREGAEFDPEALKINEFTEEQINDKSKKSVKELVEEFLEWAGKIDKKILAGHNTWFDKGFLMNAINAHELDWPFGYRVLDLHTLFYTHILEKDPKDIPIEKWDVGFGSDLVHQYVGLFIEPKPHNGLTGAKMEAEAFSRLIHGKNLLKEFEKYKIPEHLKK